ncbi:MAG: hypothetical protein IEMM0008_1046 [bacterium]|nr:MAG: hypothetical protein IEMM0008_1046 [bacterium]
MIPTSKYICILLLILSGCHAKPVIRPIGDVHGVSVKLPEYVRLEHLVQIKYQDKSFILHGFFIKEKDDFWLKAFGDFDVSLFTLRCKKNRITYQVDFKRLAERGLNIKRIGEDVWKVYYARSTKELQAFKRINPDLLEEKLELIYHDNKLLKAKCLYDKDNKLITRIIYKKYLSINNIILPKEILLENLLYKYTIKIITLNSIKDYRLAKGLFDE